MPLPKPRSDEKKDEFLSRCMGDETMNSEYPDKDQRYAVCVSQFEGSIQEGSREIRRKLARIIAEGRKKRQ